MHKTILREEEKLTGLKSALAGYEGRRADTQARLVQERAAMVTTEVDLYALRKKAVFDDSVRGAVASMQKAATKRCEDIEALRIEVDALNDRIDELGGEIARAEESARKTRIGILIEQAIEYRRQYTAAAAEAMHCFEFLSVAITQLWQENGTVDLKQTVPELLHFPRVQHGGEIGTGAPGFLVFDTNAEGGLKRVYPFKMSKEKKGEILAELLK